MLAYVLRRLLWMVPTLFGILLINFLVLRLQGNSLGDEMASSTSGMGGEGGARKAEQATGAIENYLLRFHRTGNNLPAVVNLRGFTDKADAVEWLRAIERTPENRNRESHRNQREKELWLQGTQLVQPLAAVLADDGLRELHGAASMALSLCAYTPDPRTLPVDDREAARAVNARLKDLRIDYLNTNERGYEISDPRYAEKRAALLGLVDAHDDLFGRSTAQAWKAVLWETGFVDFFRKLLTGNLISETRKENVFAVMADRWYVTFWLNLLSIVIAWGVAVPLGIRSARRLRSFEDRATTTTLFLLWSLPTFFVGTLLLHHFCTSSETGRQWFPNRGLSSPDSLWFSTPRYLVDLLWHAFLPLVVLCYGSFTSLSRYMRANVLEQLNSDYVRTARAKGCDEDRIVYRHVTRNSMVTMITLGSGLLSELFGGFVIVEWIFSINGLGSLLIDAALQRDAPLVMGSTLVSVALLLIGILVADVCYALVDPRMRSRYG